jgi:dTDP-4-dehydrorhamnose 3,5-epimerase
MASRLRGKSLKVEKTPIEGLLILVPRRFADERGFFSESWNGRTLRDRGVKLPEFVQDNHSMSLRAGTLRGLHFQSPPHGQGKLVRCGRGSLFDVAVDVRLGSPTYGRWFGTELSFENGRQLWIPVGFLHGFVTREADTEVVYKCTDHYAPECDGSVRWDSAGIDWGLSGPPILSQKDAEAQPLSAFQSPFVGEQSQ